MTKNTAKSRVRITDRDALYLGFLSRFPAADAETLSYLATRGPNPFGADPAGLTDPSGITKRMSKLVGIGAVHRHRNVVTGRTHYGTTPFGQEAARHYGYDAPEGRGINGLHMSMLEHSRAIALTAAQFASPAAPFRDVFGMPTIPLASIVSEKQIDAAYSRTRDRLKTLRDKGNNATFAAYRDHRFTTLTQEVRDGNRDARSILRDHPDLWTIAPESTNDRYRQLHKPDLVLRVDDLVRAPDADTPRNVLVEIELSSKTATEYEQTLRTLRAEIAAKRAYERVIYMVGSEGIGRAIRDADRRAGTDLISKNRLSILTIEGSTPAGAPRTATTVTVPVTPPVTVNVEDAPAPTVPHTPARTRTVPAPPPADAHVSGE